MIRYLNQEEIDRSQWDELITQAPNGLIYALSWYLDIVSPGWAALVKEERGRYVAVLPLPVHRKLGMRYLKQPAFAQLLGLFYVAEPTPAECEEIGRRLRQEFRYVVEYAFNTANEGLLQLEQQGFTMRLLKTYHLSLRPSYAELVANYKPNRRWRLNQARRRALQIEATTDIDLLIQLFHENTAHKIPGIVGETYEYRLFRALYTAASQRGMVFMKQARLPSGEVAAMILVFQFKNQLTYMFSGTTQAGKKAGAITVLLDEVFRTHAGQDICFDFEARDVANLVEFYSSFGSVPAPFPAISYNRLPWPVRQLRAARLALYRRLRPRPAPGHP